MKFKRTLDLRTLLAKKSHFLFGPRATGKSTLIREQLEGSFQVNLLDSDLYFRLVANPSLLIEMLPSDKKIIIVIDEVQRIPELLNIVHKLIEEDKRKFLLTGSSARKLKHGQANLLAGRAWQAELFPLTFQELGKHFNLSKILTYGSLPGVFTSDFPEEELRAYTRTYLYEEIQAEGLVRKIPQFSRFLQTSALASGELINYSNISSDSGVPASTLKEHYKILEDTLIGYQLYPWLRGNKRKAIQTSKFYFFDCGVTNALSGTKTLDPNSDLWGKSFEQWSIGEVRAYLSYQRRDDTLCFWRSTSNEEVDLIIGDHTAIEIKSTKRVTGKHLKGLYSLKEEGRIKKFFLISMDKIEQRKDHIVCLHYADFFKKLWAGELF
jgi:predicted AAA+ superfamily ATPase